MIIIPALVYLHRSPHTKVFLQKFGWQKELQIDLYEDQKEEADSGKLH